jgi:RNA polymerase sigma-70 factor (ECF subfamily)
VTDLVLSRIHAKRDTLRWETIYGERVSAYRVAFAILGRREAAEDVVEEALLKALESKVEPQNVAAWVRTIVVRTALNARRDKATVGLEFEPEIHCELDEGIAVRATLARLESDQRALLALAIGEGLSYRELADVFGVPEGTISSRLHAAKAAFRREWDS